MATRNIVPRATGEGGIGTSAKKWGAFYALLAYIEGGTISGADITVGSGKTLDVSAGTLTLANDQISGDKIHGGTISAFASTGIDDNADAVAITIDSAGNVGIGATSPVAGLEVQKLGTYNTNAWFGTANTANASYHYDRARVAISGSQIDGQFGSGIHFQVRNTANTNLFHSVITQDRDGKLGFETGGAGVTEPTERISILYTGNVGIGTTSPVNKLDVEGAVAIGAAYSGTSTAPTNGLIVEGNVGIGTTSPGYKLDIVGNIKATTGITMVGTLGSAILSGTGAVLEFSRAGMNYINATDALGGLTLQTGGANPRITVGSSGKVGIGTTSSVNKLDVEGAVAIGAAYSGTSTAPTNGLIVEGNVGIGTASPTSYLHLKAGTTAASTAPLKLTTGTVNTTAEAGAIEYNNTFHVTNSDTTRRHIATSPNATKTTAAAPYTNDGYITINIGGTDFKVMTTA